MWSSKPSFNGSGPTRLPSSLRVRCLPESTTQKPPLMRVSLRFSTRSSLDSSRPGLSGQNAIRNNGLKSSSGRPRQGLNFNISRLEPSSSRTSSDELKPNSSSNFAGAEYRIPLYSAVLPMLLDARVNTAPSHREALRHNLLMMARNDARRDDARAVSLLAVVLLVMAIVGVAVASKPIFAGVFGKFLSMG